MRLCDNAIFHFLKQEIIYYKYLTNCPETVFCVVYI